MTKSKTILAGLGVVAALGVAALPLTSFATGEPSVSGNVRIELTVNPAIAMTIESDGDNGSAAVTQIDPGTYATEATGPSIADGTMEANSYNETDLHSTITVTTNADDGYTLTAVGADLILQDTNGDVSNPTADQKIVASDSTSQIAAGAGGYNLKMTSRAGTAVSSYLDATAATLSGTEAGAATGSAGHEYQVYYGISTLPGQATGTYKGLVAYTATSAN